MATITTSPTSTTRRPYHGSCHCGNIRYVLYLTLPPRDIPPINATSSVRLRKCNCSTCHKMGFFHVRVPNAPTDFFLLSPLNPKSGEKGGLGDLGDYQCFQKSVSWYFCKNCAVRCFTLAGEGSVVDFELPNKDRGVVKAWRPMPGWKEGSGNGNYLSINAVTLEPGQEGLDLREWTEKGWIQYLNELDEVKDDRMKVPFQGGTY